MEERNYFVDFIEDDGEIYRVPFSFVFLAVEGHIDRILLSEGFTIDKVKAPVQYAADLFSLWVKSRATTLLFYIEDKHFYLVDKREDGKYSVYIDGCLNTSVVTGDKIVALLESIGETIFVLFSYDGGYIDEF